MAHHRTTCVSRSSGSRTVAVAAGSAARARRFELFRPVIVHDVSTEVNEPFPAPQHARARRRRRRWHDARERLSALGDEELLAGARLVEELQAVRLELADGDGAGRLVADGHADEDGGRRGSGQVKWSTA